MNARTTENILAIDTTTAVFSLALGTAEGQWYFEADAGPRHSQLLMEITDFLIKKACLKPAELSRVVCMNGPGSFTGLRIGFSSAKALGLSLGIPFSAVLSLDCMAYPYLMWPGPVLPLIDAKKKSWFCALYKGGTRLTPDMDAQAAEIARVICETFSGQDREHIQVLLAGPDAGQIDSDSLAKASAGKKIDFIVAPACRRGSARELLAIAQTQKIINNENKYFLGGPEYLRKSDAEINLGV